MRAWIHDCDVVIRAANEAAALAALRSSDAVDDAREDHALASATTLDAGFRAIGWRLERDDSGQICGLWFSELRRDHMVLPRLAPFVEHGGWMEVAWPGGSCRWLFEDGSCREILGGDDEIEELEF